MNPSILLFFAYIIYSHILMIQTLSISGNSDCITLLANLSLVGYGIKDLEGSDSVSLQKDADWWNLTSSASSAKITQTTSTLKWILGGPDILGAGNGLNPFPAFVRTYTNLPPHSFVGISVKLWYFDDTGGINNFTGFSLTISGRESSIRGPKLRQNADFTTADGGFIDKFDLGRDQTKFAFFSEASELTLKVFHPYNPDNPFVQSFGFRDLHLHFSNYSGGVLDLCHISEDLHPLQWNQCPCPINQAKDSSGNCVSCAANCDSCFGPADNQCLACSAGAYWDGSKCNTCDLMCQTCTGTTSNECPTCKYGFYNYRNSTCITICELPFVAEQMGIDLFCNLPCTASQFYWADNSTCLNKCDPPLIHTSDENGIEYCLNPCEGTKKYLYANGSCYEGCKAPLMPRNDDHVRYCVNPCSLPSYLFSNGSCVSTCPPPLLSRYEPGTNYCWSPCLVASYFLYNNGSCEMTCPAPLISRSEPGVKYCYTPCTSVNEFIYNNRSCENSCSSPLVSRIEPLVAKYCLNPCPSNYFLYPNGSCFAECSWPLRNRTEPGVKYCYSPCSDFIYQNGTCEDKCPSPLMSRDEPNFRYCLTPCKFDEYLYSDHSCHDSCESPLIKRLEPGVKYCNTPCSESEYVYQDGTCRSKCEYHYKILSNPSYKVCSMNLDEIQVSQAKSLARATDIANTICGIGGLLTGFVAPGDPTSMLMWSLLKMLQFVKYIDVNFSGQMIIIFSTQNDNYNNKNEYMSSLGRSLSAQGDDLGRFSYYGIPHSFLENYWQQLIVFAVLISLIIVSSLLSSFLKNPEYIKICRNLKSNLKWNVVLMFFCGSSGDLILYSAIEFQTAGSLMSFIVCLFMVILAFYIPLKILYVIKTIRKAKMNQPEKDAKKLWLHNRVFFESYKSDHFIQQIFLFIYLVRVALFNIIIGYIFKSSLSQALLISFLNFGMLTYLVLKTPIKDKFCFAQHVTLESMLFVYHLCLLILVIMDLTGAEVESTRAFFGGIMVVILIVGPVGMAVLIVLKLFLKSRNLYQQFRAKKESKKFINNAFRFKKVRSRGNFVIGNDETLNINFETLNQSTLNGVRADESHLMIIPFEREIPTRGILKNKLKSEEEGGSLMNINVEKNLENLIVQIFAKKESNFKRRKINVFKNDDYLPD